MSTFVWPAREFFSIGRARSPCGNNRTAVFMSLDYDDSSVSLLFLFFLFAVHTHINHDGRHGFRHCRRPADSAHQLCCLYLLSIEFLFSKLRLYLPSGVKLQVGTAGMSPLCHQVLNI